MKKKRTRIVNRKKFFAFVLTTMLIAVLVVFVLFNKNNVYSSEYESKYVEIKIEKGDTLWTIALENKPQKYDTRKMVYEIMKFNNLAEEYIYPGNIIKIPITNENK